MYHPGFSTQETKDLVVMNPAQRAIYLKEKLTELQLSSGIVAAYAGVPYRKLVAMMDGVQGIELSPVSLNGIKRAFDVGRVRVVLEVITDNELTHSQVAEQLGFGDDLYPFLVERRSLKPIYENLETVVYGAVVSDMAFLDPHKESKVGLVSLDYAGRKTYLETFLTESGMSTKEIAHLAQVTVQVIEAILNDPLKKQYAKTLEKLSGAVEAVRKSYGTQSDPRGSKEETCLTTSQDVVVEAVVAPVQSTVILPQNLLEETGSRELEELVVVPFNETIPGSTDLSSSAQVENKHVVYARVDPDESFCPLASMGTVERRDYIKKTLRDYAYSGCEFAKRIGMDQGTLSFILRLKTKNPSNVTLRQLYAGLTELISSENPCLLVGMESSEMRGLFEAVLTKYNLTQKEFAERTGIPVSPFRAFMEGRRTTFHPSALRDYYRALQMVDSFEEPCPLVSMNPSERAVVIKDTLRAYSMSNKEFAEVAEVPTSTLEKILSGERKDPKNPTLQKIYSAIVILNPNYKFGARIGAPFEEGTEVLHDSTEFPDYGAMVGASFEDEEKFEGEETNGVALNLDCLLDYQGASVPFVTDDNSLTYDPVDGAIFLSSMDPAKRAEFVRGILKDYGYTESSFGRKIGVARGTLDSILNLRTKKPYSQGLTAIYSGLKDIVSSEVFCPLIGMDRLERVSLFEDTLRTYNLSQEEFVERTGLSFYSFRLFMEGQPDVDVPTLRTFYGALQLAQSFEKPFVVVDVTSNSRADVIQDALDLYDISLEAFVQNTGLPRETLDLILADNIEGLDASIIQTIDASITQIKEDAKKNDLSGYLQRRMRKTGLSSDRLSELSQVSVSTLNMILTDDKTHAPAKTTIDALDRAIDEYTSPPKRSSCLGNMNSHERSVYISDFLTTYGYSDSEFARRAGLPQVTVSQIIREKYSQTRPYIIRNIEDAIEAIKSLEEPCPLLVIPLEEVRELVKTTLTTHHLSHKKFATFAGVSPSRIDQLLDGRVEQIKPTTLKAIHKAITALDAESK
ncbi:MAG: hypothetical protein WC254_02575 [Candidatus Woesearchaeota archaeon]|jgi:transcriptional regulator with XRE-family HTH domain/lambda repressor-like predicted transcriptional regulator